MGTIIDRHKKLFIILGIILITIVVIAVKKPSLLGSLLKVKASSGSSGPTVPITYENIEPVMSGSSLIRDLPSNTLLVLRFYNYNTGEMQWEKSYAIKKGEVKEGYTEGADITFTLDSKYLEGLTNKNFCSMIQTAKANGDLGIHASLSEAALVWKFKGMFKYRECLGF